MSSSTLSNVLIFTAGLAIGSVVTWKLLKTRYEQIAQEEIDSVYEAISRRDEVEETGDSVAEDLKDGIERAGEGFEKAGEAVRKAAIDIREYAETLSKNNYTNYNDAKEAIKVKRPYVIPPEDFGELDDYDTISLTYYSDGVLADDMDEIVEDVDDIVGRDSLSHFGEYEDDSVFVRNDNMRADYEILLDERKYSDVANKNPHLAEEE